MPAEKRSVSPTAGEEEGSPTKRPKSLHQWLHPDLPAPLMAHSPALHDSTSTFLSFSLSLVPPAHVTSEASLAKEAKRMIRELDVPRLVSEECMRADEGAFQDGEGRIGRPGQERIREPDHRMWACRALCLKEGADGTKGEHDYQASPPSMAKLMRQLLESLLDDGEKFGGDRVLRVLKEQRAVDVLTVCCRWYGGDNIGPIRFQHIGLTAQTSIKELSKLVLLRDLRVTLESLDEEIASMRATLSGSEAKGAAVGVYEAVEDVERIRRLIRAREKTKGALEGQVAWKALESAKGADVEGQ